MTAGLEAFRGDDNRHTRLVGAVYPERIIMRMILYFNGDCECFSF